MSPAPQYRPRVAADDFLTEADRLLLLREFDAPEPESLPGLVDRLPPGTPMPTILYRYHVRPKGGMQNKHLRPFIRCAHCEGKRHWKGFVIQLDDGSLALLGHTCGQDQFGIDFRRVEADFYAARNRQADLGRLVEIRGLIPAFEQELDALRYSGVMAAFDTYMTGLRRFGQLRLVLQDTARRNDGVLTCRAVHRDREAEERHAKSLPQYKHYLEKIGGALTDFMRRERVQEQQRWLESLPRIEHEEIEALGRIAGGGIFYMGLDGSLVRDMQGPRNLLAVQIDEFMSNRSDYWNKRKLSSGVNRLRQGINLIYRGLGLLQELDKFTSADNLATIAKWSQREVELPQPRIAFAVKASGRTLIDEDGRFQLVLPPTWALPTTPHVNALARVLGEVAGD
jgi:hypothetical protein